VNGGGAVAFERGRLRLTGARLEVLKRTFPKCDVLTLLNRDSPLTPEEVGRYMASYPYADDALIHVLAVRFSDLHADRQAERDARQAKHDADCLYYGKTPTPLPGVRHWREELEVELRLYQQAQERHAEARRRKAMEKPTDIVADCGGLIKVTRAEMDLWRPLYKHIVDLEAEIFDLADWANDEAAKNGGNWQRPLKGALKKRNAKLALEEQPADDSW
jgi:hypothetical protein